jgi:methyl-accepting chemotaxis protein
MRSQRAGAIKPASPATDMGPRTRERADQSHWTNEGTTMAFWNDMKLRPKFALVAVVAVGMSVLPATEVVRERLEMLASARAEAAGVAPAGALLKLVRVTQQHRGLSASMLAGNDAARARRQAVQAEVDQALAAATTALAALEHASLPHTRLAALREQWQPLAEGVGARRLDAAASFSGHGALIAAQLDLLRDVVEHAGMSRDPDPAAHHAVNAALEQLPRLTEALGQLRARGAGMLQKQAATPEDKARIEALATMARLFAGQAAHALEQIGQTNAAFAQALTQPRAQARALADEGLALAESALLKAETPNHPPAAYFERQTQAIDAQFALIDAAFTQLRQVLDERASHSVRMLALLGASMLALGALSLALLLSVTRSTLRGIDVALDLARTVAAGDLSSTVQVTSRDETGQLLGALKAMNDSLVSLVGQVRDTSVQIATGAGQIASGSADLSQRTEEQASNLQQTAASMEQLNASVRHNADALRQAAGMALSASDVARRGGQDMMAVVATMAQISEASRRIADIIGVIDGIAFQTNILALNAAVEAARAGEHGRGFAVVASEVRSLAQRSAQAAREIKSLIHTSAERVDNGMRQVAGAGATMERIVAQVQQVDALISEIGEATQQQAGGIGQVGGAVDQLDQVTQQNAALVEESAAAADSLSQQAQRLVQSVGQFRLAPA